MEHHIKSIRPFIGAKDFKTSSNFYKALGFEEKALSHNLTYFSSKEFGFYLQDAFVKDWVDNTMVFMEVENVDRFWKELLELKLPEKFEGVRTEPVRIMDWGKECFIHDPSGILWHVGEFFS